MKQIGVTVPEIDDVTVTIRMKDGREATLTISEQVRLTLDASIFAPHKFTATGFCLTGMREVGAILIAGAIE